MRNCTTRMSKTSDQGRQSTSSGHSSRVGTPKMPCANSFQPHNEDSVQRGLMSEPGRID